MKRKLLLLSLIALIQIISNSTQAQSWQPIGTGTSSTIYTLAVDPVTNLLFAGGAFISAGGNVCNHIAKWDGTAWTAMGMHMGADNSMLGTGDTVQCMAIYHDTLYAGGHFKTAEGLIAYHIAYWDGTDWYHVGDSMNGDVHALAVYNGELYASGEFTYVDGMSINHIAKWNGTSWSAVGVGLDDDAEVLTVYNGKLIAGGDFFKSGPDSVNNIAQWDGTSWTGLGTGMSTTAAMVTMGMPSMVHSLAVYNGKLYAGGMYLYAGGQNAANIAQWDGTAWSGIGTVGSGNMSDDVAALAVNNGKLYVGGDFLKINNQTVNNIASWDGTSWSTVDFGMNSMVNALTVYNNDLIAAGSFNTAGANNINYVARYGFPAGIENVTSTNSVSLYPNPIANNTATIQLNKDINAADHSLVLENLLGRQVSNIPFTSMNNVQKGAYEFSINKTLAKGIYTYHVMEQQNKVASGKLVIQ
ncbi:MAG: T9SS type A sorting domain-containing protein [Bacteroidota bacterium]